MKTYNIQLSLIYKHLIIGVLYCLCTPIQAQVGMIWGETDRDTTITMSNDRKIEVVHDIANTKNFVYALVGQSDYVLSTQQSLFLYKYYADGTANGRGRLIWKRKLSNKNEFFQIENLHAPVSLHLEATDNDVYVAGAMNLTDVFMMQAYPCNITSPTGLPDSFLCITDTTNLPNPSVSNPQPVLFIANYDAISGSYKGHSLIKNYYNSLQLTGNSFIADMDIDPATGNVFVLGKAVEQRYSPPPIYIATPYIPVGGGRYDDLSFAFRPESIHPPRQTKSTPSDPFRLDFLCVGASRTSPSSVTGNVFTLAASEPCPTGASNVENSSEIAFVVGYNRDLTDCALAPQHITDYTEGQRGTVNPTSLSIDGDNLYIAGGFSRTLFGDTTCAEITVSTNFGTGAFAADTMQNKAKTVSRYTSDGLVIKKRKSGGNIFIKKIGGKGSQIIQDINVKNDNIILALMNVRNTVVDTSQEQLLLRASTTTYHRAWQDEQGLFLLQMLNGGSINEAIIQKYHTILPNTINSALSTTRFAIPNDGIQVDEKNNIYLAGVFDVSLNMTNSPYTQSTTPTIQNGAAAVIGASDFMITKYSSNFDRLWTKVIGGGGTEIVPRVKIDSTGGFYLAGGYQLTMDLEPAPSIVNNIQSRGSYDGFLARYGCYKVIIQQDTNPICAGSPMRLGITNNCPYGAACSFIYNWTNPSLGATFPTTSNQYILVPNTGTNLLLLNSTETNTTCLDQDTFEFIAGQPITLNVASRAVQICANASTLLSANSNLSQTRYKWYFNNNLLAPIDTTAAINITLAGTYRVVAEVAGCKVNETVVVNAFTPQFPQIIPDTPTICGSTTELSVINCSGCSYNWTIPAGSNANTTSNSLLADVQGTYSVNIVDANGCSYFKTKNVLNAPYLSPNIIAKNNNGDNINTVCNGQPLIIETLPYCPTCNYLWTDGSTANFTFAFGAGNFAVTVVNTANSCVGVSNTLAINASSVTPPTIQLNPANICKALNTSETPAEIFVSNIAPSMFYRWYDNRNTNFNLGLGTSFNAIKKGDYVVVATDNFECSEYSNIVTVDSFEVSTPEIYTNHQKLCGMNTAVLSTPPCQGCAYQWYQTASGNSNISTIFGANQSTYVVSQSVPAVYYVEVQYGNTCKRFSAGLTIDTSTFSVNVDKTAKYICNGASALVSLQGALQLPPNWSYQWHLNGVAIPNATGYAHNATQAGLYYIKVTNQDSCIAISDTIRVNATSAGANPIMIADPAAICVGANTRLTASHNPCTSCKYGWRLDDNTLMALTDSNSYSTPIPRGFYVSVKDTISNCIYNSNIVQIRDTFLATPILSASTNPTCNPTGVGAVLTTQALPNAQYIWKKGGASGDTMAITLQNSFVINSRMTVTAGRFNNTVDTLTSSNYVVVVKQGDCISQASNDVPVSFRTFDARLDIIGSPTLCNGGNAILDVNLGIASNITTCPKCEYSFFNGTNALPQTLKDSTKIITGAGSYFAVVRDSLSNCTDTTFSINITSAEAAIKIRSTTTITNAVGINRTYLCSNVSNTTLTIGACQNCTYSWYKGSTSVPLAGIYDTVLILNGTAAADKYYAKIDNNGCSIWDSISVDAIAPANLFTVTISLQTPNILDTAFACLGVPSQLTEAGGVATRWQWALNDVPIAGVLARVATYQTANQGKYYVIATDSFGCTAKSNSLWIRTVYPDTAYKLVFDPLNPMPITAAAVDLDNYLFPIAKRPANGRGLYTSLTASTAINANTHFFTPSAAGAGLHLITYYDSVGACVFPITDTIEVLQQLSVSMSNKRVPTAPIYETCIRDSIHIELSNFAFAPNAIQFYTDTGYRTISVTPTLTSYGSVYNGYVPVFIPQGARTGRVRLTDGTNNYQTPFFVVVHNPAVSMNLVGVTQPLCSTTPTVTLTGTPATSGPTGFGVFTAAYATSPNSPSTSLLATGSNVLNVNNITGYDFSGRQDLILKYAFIPTYSDVAQTRCLDSVVAVLNAQARDVSLVSVQYTPISISQGAEPMENLSRLVFPVNSRLYTGTYTGTYVNAGSIVPNTIASFLPAATTDTVRYTINNGGCTNSTTMSLVSILPTPTITSVPSYICRIPNDTIFIGRNASGMYTRRGAVTSAPYNTNYLYQENIVNQPAYSYIEKMHMMTLTSSNGGLSLINNTPGQELYAFIPSAIPGTVTNLNIKFGYYRTTDYFDLAALVNPTDTSSYIIGQNTISINFEDLPVVEISPATDTVFCQQENIFYQFSGTPNALPTGVPNGRFYLKRPSNNTVDTLANNNNLFNPFTNPVTSGTLASAFEVYQLKYEYIGFACRDSAFKNIKVVKPFIINYATTSGIEFCQEEPDAAVTFTSPNLLVGNSLDTANCVFSVGGVPAGNFFSPSLRGTGTFATTFLAKDIFGCTAESAATFTVHSTPTLAMTFAPTLTIPAAICANNVPIDMAIFKNGRNITNNLLSATTFTIQSVRNAVINGATNQTTNLASIPNYLGFRATSTPSNSPTLYNRRDTTVLDTIIYSLRDSNGCFNRITQPITVYQLPALGLTELGGAPVQPTYCEGTSVRFVGAPLGGAFIGAGSITTTNASSTTTPPAVTVTALSAPSLNAATGLFTPSITPASVISVTETFAYTYQDVNTGCRDTIIKSTISLNRAEVTITGIPTTSATCASLNSSYPLGITSTGAAVSSYSFTSTPSTAVVTGTFYPSRANAVADPVNVGFLLTYISNGCVNTATATHLVNPLPILRFTPPGDTLANSAGKGYHICRSGVQQLLIAQNKFGSINPYTTINPQNNPAFPNEFRGRGVVYDATSGYYVYNPAIGNAGYDTLVYTYTDPRGCRDSVKNTVFVDTVPTLGFAGFNPSHLLGDTLRPDTFMYCANEPAFLVVPSPFGGFLSFQNQLQGSGVYNVLPDNLDTNPATTYEMKYVFISARYQNGGVCQDSAKVYLQVRPTPVLNFVNLPPQICAADSSDTLHLSATPVGGTFQDYTIGAVAGIINGNIFNANAQYGNRDLRYFYTDPVSTCSDTVYQQIKVYRIPEAGFTSAGGCQNDVIVLAPTPNALSSTLPGRDSITMYVWDYGNGITDTIRPTGTSVVVPNRNYTYPDAGIFFPQLTIVNRASCVDTFVLRIPVSSKVTVTPANAYVQDFEAGSDWMQATDTIAIPTDSVWGIGIATGARITTQQENNHVWKTHLDSIYQPGERGVVYSPCFDISALRRPMFAMDMITDTREGIDGAILEYLHPTRGWVALGSRYKGINWYDSLYLVSAPGAQISNPTIAPIGWSGDTEWVNGFQTARFRLDTDIRNGDLRGMTSLRFRMAFAASPNTVVASREGVAFDNIYLGERGRSVLVEHFTNIYTPGINVLQDTLYRRLFNPLYGRDVVLLQYHSNNDPSIASLDGYFDNSSTISQARSYYYGVFALPRVRINGQNYVASTADFVNPYTDYLEYLDMEMLEDKTFDIRIPTTPQIFQAVASATVGSMNSSVVITAAKDLPQAKYVAHAVITEDSLGGIPNTHKMMSVVRAMLPNAAGTSYEFAWAAGDAQTLTLNSTFPVKLSNTSSFNTYKPNNLRLVVFVQDDSSKLVHQVATSRNLTIYNGAVAVEELPMEEGKEIMEFNLFPNPAQDQFNIAFDQALQGEYQWRLVDMLGQTLREGRAQAGTEQLTIPTNEYASGMYIFTINNDKVYSQRQVIIARP